MIDNTNEQMKQLAGQVKPLETKATPGKRPMQARSE
jgi:hypothetical protein